MTVISEELGDDSDDIAHQQAPPNVVVVTEHQVMLGSAVAISAPARQVGRPHRFIRVVRWALGWSTRTPEQERPKHRPHPQRTPTWYSDALMAREMYRL